MRKELVLRLFLKKLQQKNVDLIGKIALGLDSHGVKPSSRMCVLGRNRNQSRTLESKERKGKGRDFLSGTFSNFLLSLSLALYRLV